MPALCSADKTSYMTKKNDYVSKKFIKNYILNTKTKFSAACHNLLQVVTCSRKFSFCIQYIVFNKLL